MNSDWTTAFRDKRVLVTGHTGFKGSWLTIWLHKLGAKITGLALDPPTDPSLFEIADVESLLEQHIVSDICEPAAVRAVVNDARPEYVFHLAAQPLVAVGFDEPHYTFETNFVGTLNVLEAVRKRRSAAPCAVVIVTSDKCYRLTHGPADARPLTEDDALGGADPYSASKAAAEIVTGAYAASFFAAPEHAPKTAVATARAGNVIGGGDWAEYRIIPDLVENTAESTPTPIRCPSARRPWQHLLEPLSGYLLLAARLAAGDDAARGAWNFGPPVDHAVPVQELAERFLRAFGRGTWVDASDPLSAAREAHTLLLSSDKARMTLGWRPRWSLDESIARTAAWYRQFCAAPESDMRQACLDDIAAYEAAGPLP